ncbi:MAG: CDP-alcohol phosphatidyltransferase family protein [Candidatus Kapaibacterium sp.]
MKQLKKIWTASNLLSISRALLAIPFGIALWNEAIWWTLGIGFAAGLTDYLDGRFAREFDETTELGKILDPAADKIFIAVAVVILLLMGRLPLWFVGLIVGRDLLIALGGLWALGKIKFTIPSNMFGKVTVNVISIVLIGIILDVGVFYTWGIYVSAAMVIVSFIIYLRRMMKMLSEDSGQ